MQESVIHTLYTLTFLFQIIQLQISAQNMF